MEGIDLLSRRSMKFRGVMGSSAPWAMRAGETIADALNRPEHHAAIEAAFRTNIPLAAKAGVPNVITFSGNRRGMATTKARATPLRA